MSRQRKYSHANLGGDARVTYDDSLVNVSAAVLLRQMYYKEVGVEVSRPTVSVRDVLREARMRLLGSMRSWVEKYSWKQFLSTYSGMKLARYTSARDSLMETPVQRSDAEVRAFIKHEKLEPGAVPRVISPRSYRYLAAVGLYLKSFEGPLYTCLRRMFGEKVVMKGMNSTDQARLLRRKWDRFSEPVAISIDASRFDQHVSKAMLQWEHSVWLAFCKPELRGRLAEMLSWQLVNKIRFVSEGNLYQYTLEGQRMSGDMNTGSGNCMIMCCAVYSFMASLGLGVGEYALIDNGDDATIITERRHEARILGAIDGFFSALGFRMKIEDPVYRFEQIDFCQTRPVWNGRSWSMQRTVSSVLAKDAVCLHANMGLKELKVWMYDVGEAGLAISSGIPILQELYLMYQRLGTEKRTKRGIGSYSLTHLAKGLVSEAREITAESRVSFWEAFGLEPVVQVVLEERIRNVRRCATGEWHKSYSPVVPQGV